MARKKYKRRKEIQSAIFWIGLGILWLTDSWWPGILIIFGISILASTWIAGSESKSLPEPSAPESRLDTTEPHPPTAAPSPQPKPTALSQTPAPEPVKLDWLPETCEACGAPIGIEDVFIEADDSAICPYCDHAITKPPKA